MRDIKRHMETGCGSELRLAVSMREAVEISGLGRDSLYQAIRRGELKAHKVGRRTLILMSDLSAFLSSRPELHGAGGEGTELPARPPDER
jgi:excisionase family DNA binding protein